MNICYANTIDYNFYLQQRPHHIMTKLSERGHNIFWVDQHSRKDIFQTKITDNLSVFHDWDKFCAKYKGQIDIYFSSWSRRWVDIDKLKPKLVIYDSIDMFPQNQGEEKKMVDNSDVILATTKSIYDFHRKHTNKPIYMCENGCFASLRNKSFPIPNDIKNLPKPWILFSGALAADSQYGWVDLDLIEAVSKKYTTLIVGSIWGVSPNEEARIKGVKLSKAYFLGNKDYIELQKYYANCDVNLLPFKRCQISDFSSPLKLVEGCNYGKICVATDIPVASEFNKEYPLAVLSSKNKDEFLKNIDLAITIKDKEEAKNQCYSLADFHDWNRKVDIIETTIKNHMPNRKGGV